MSHAFATNQDEISNRYDAMLKMGQLKGMFVANAEAMFDAPLAPQPEFNSYKPPVPGKKT